ncbi:Fibronectin-attachment protein (FAP) [Mycolicibacterium chubuense NBB4]|uniref:Alanine and proline-rich secreted protein Apa n=1 Tax=Mycolicibacterium chubuense (strain NBB4) TaxID=710421 RepID=I4BJV9_MYCCN|nr:APA family fibronectin-binding glycoprotein [Mycolicibacterium chubuense]AFM17566.1 Fibronectin-attachment protein (FAP) [Mycolicibacterium chubuense NBB4]
MDQPDVHPLRRRGISKSLGLAALTGVTVAALALPPAALAQPAPPAPPPSPTAAPPPPADPNAPPPPADPNAPPPPADPNAPPPPAAAPGAPGAPPADPNAPPPPPAPGAPPADPNAPAPAPAPAPEPGRVDNAAGGFSYVVPAGWKTADATQLSYGQALLTKLPPQGAPPDAQPPNDTSVLLGRLDLKLFAGAEADNTKAAQRLASDMGEFFMPFPGTRINQKTVPLDANGMTGVASYYEVKFTDTNKPNGQIWAGVVGAPTPPGTPRGQRAPERWFVVWLGTANNPIPQDQAVILANSIRPYTAPPPPPPPDPNAPPPPPDPNAPAPRPAVGVPVPVNPNNAPGMLPPA